MSKTAEASPPSSPLSWSPDGKQISSAGQADPHVGDSDQTVLEIIDVDTPQMRQLTKRSSFETFGIISPDASKIAYRFPRDRDFNGENEIFVAPSAGGEGTDETPAQKDPRPQASPTPLRSKSVPAGTPPCQHSVVPPTRG